MVIIDRRRSHCGEYLVQLEQHGAGRFVVTSQCFRDAHLTVSHDSDLVHGSRGDALTLARDTFRLLTDG